MSKCTALEPAPTRFYAPSGLFTDEDLRQLSAEYLGELIVSPGGSFRTSGDLGPTLSVVLGVQQTPTEY
ncbi:hypothetical protein [Chlorogloea sp. CCALA 695]|uniref:hypothetical protein n=1 Tax=Chlorogloea sp. CCALA 695 TaxID=2107693 RepID=UPI000D073D09|nr:hypothetical protein [Chlorogloea sp. CCALA 695]PSB24437.1 hypothetical protein C7B70_25455 [Chlorogloea sp. CCALA 695]